MEPSQEHSTAEHRRAAGRLSWLDGVRGGAALFVVLHHMWLSSWPHYPETHGPWWLTPLLYGQLAVVVFIVVSGYSLTIAPAARGGRLVGGARRFIRRRAWRILPAYWAALVVSMVLFLTFLAPDTDPSTAAKSFVVHAGLVQNVFDNVAPNGTFWSIAVEWQIYFAFPLILILALRVRIGVAIALTCAVVIGAHLLAAASPALDKINHLTPQFLALFALGVLAAWLAHTPTRLVTQIAVAAVTATAFAGTVALGVVQGSVWMVSHWFWVDLLFGVGVAGCLWLASHAEPKWLKATLGSRQMVFLGMFSYSIYLFHAPLLALIEKYIVDPLALGAGLRFALLATCALPVLLIACYGFFVLFERPFLTRRSFATLRTLPVWTAFATFGRPGRVKEETV